MWSGYANIVSVEMYNFVHKYSYKRNNIIQITIACKVFNYI